MARTVEQIQRDIVALEQAVGKLTRELSALDHQYLTVLGQTLKRQLIQTGYHICTQGYPEQFLSLSLAQRQELQQSLQQLARQAQEQLQNPQQLVETHYAPLPLTVFLVDSDNASDLEEELAHLAHVARDMAPSEKDDGPSPKYQDGEEEAEAGDNEGRMAADEDEDEDEDEAEAGDEEEEPEEPPLTLATVATPDELLRWQEKLERGIVETLQTLSHSANLALQRANILPAQLPEPILEVAAKTGMAESSSGPPNTLNLIVETETNNNKETTSVTHVMAIRLRLAELEFGDAELTSLRSQLRGLANRINQLRQEYQKRQREKAIAEAEAAWRSSWYEQ